MEVLKVTGETEHTRENRAKVLTQKFRRGGLGAKLVGHARDVLNGLAAAREAWQGVAPQLQLIQSSLAHAAHSVRHLQTVFDRLSCQLNSFRRF